MFAVQAAKYETEDPLQLAMLKRFPGLTKKQCYENLAIKYEIDTYRNCVREYCKEWGLDEQISSEVVDEWYALILTNQDQADVEGLQHGTKIEGILAGLRLCVQGLDPNCTWKELLSARFKEWKPFIARALEEDIDFLDLIIMKYSSEHFEDAIRLGASPEISHETLLELIKQDGWKSLMRIKALELGKKS